MVLLLELFDDLPQEVGALARLEPVPNPFLADRLHGRQILFLQAHGKEIFEVFSHIHDGRAGAGTLSHDLKILRRELVHHNAAVLAVGDLRHQRGDLLAGEFPAREPLGLVIGLHLRDELGVAALGLDDGDDGSLLPAGVAADEAVRQVFALGPLAVLGPLDGVFLDEDPLVTAVLEGLDEFVNCVRVVGQRHFGGREPAHATQRLETEDRREVVLPGGDMQAKVLRRRGGRHGVSPRATEPFHGPSVPMVAGDSFQIIEHIIQAHLAKAVQEGSGVFQHHPRLLAFVHQLRDEFPHAFVAPAEDRGVVVIANARVIHHVLEVADDFSRGEIVAPGGDKRLMHVQRHGKGAADAAEVNPTLRQEDRLAAAGAKGGFDLRFSAADIGQTAHVFRYITHRFSCMSVVTSVKRRLSSTPSTSLCQSRINVAAFGCRDVLASRWLSVIK